MSERLAFSRGEERRENKHSARHGNEGCSIGIGRAAKPSNGLGLLETVHLLDKGIKKSHSLKCDEEREAESRECHMSQQATNMPGLGNF